MVFRPLPILTLAATPILAALLWLGVWQAQRAGWKADLIAQYESNIASQPATLEQLLCGNDGSVEDRGFVSGAEVAERLAEAPDARPPIRMFGHADTGEAGWRLFRPIAPPACAVDSGDLLVETGLEPLQTGTLPQIDRPSEVPERYVLTSWPARPWMSAENDPASNDWHWFDAAPMAEALGVERINDRFYLSESRGLPDFLERTPPSRHIGYSVTWFGMAAALIVMYAAFHARAGRLKFGKDSQTR